MRWAAVPRLVHEYRIAGPCWRPVATKVQSFDQVGRLLKRVIDRIRVSIYTSKNVDRGLRDQTRDGRAADVLYGCNPAQTRLQNAATGLLELLFPTRVVMHQSHGHAIHSR